MDVSDILAAHDAKQYVYTLQSLAFYSGDLCRKAVTVEKDIPLEVDAGFLTVTDLNPVDKESYEYVHRSI